jgi:hypothetical protein
MTDDPVSWRGLLYGTPVVASDGTRVGTVREVLGSDADDIFHGLRVALDGQADAKRDVMVPADAIDALGTAEVRVARSAAEVRALGDYDEAATYHLASVGWLRTHLGWKKDAASDEEAG